MIDYVYVYTDDGIFKTKPIKETPKTILLGKIPGFYVHRIFKTNLDIPPAQNYNIDPVFTSKEKLFKAYRKYYSKRRAFINKQESRFNTLFENGVKEV